MAFKGGSDDAVKPGLPAGRPARCEAREVLCTDPLVTTDQDLLPLDQVLRRADLLVIWRPSSHYARRRTELPGGGHLEPAPPGRPDLTCGLAWPGDNQPDPRSYGGRTDVTSKRRLANHSVRHFRGCCDGRCPLRRR